MILLNSHGILLCVVVGLVAKSCLTLETLGTVACQAPLFIGFSRQEYWSKLPFPSLGDLPDPETEPMSRALAGGFSSTKPPGKPTWTCACQKKIPLWAGETAVTKPALFLDLCSNSDSCPVASLLPLSVPSGHVASHSPSLPRAHIFPTTSYNWQPACPMGIPKIVYPEE